MTYRKINLSEIANIKAGYPFRGQIPYIPSGTVKVIQMKHVHESSGIYWDELISTNLEGRKKPDYLEKDDIVFAARGNNNFAVCLDEVPGKAVCSPHFYQIHIHDPKKVLPGYVAWYINQSPAQQYLISSAEGTMIRSIRRAVLEALPVVVPELKKQVAIVGLDLRVKQENRLLLKQMDYNRAMLNAIARDLTN